MCLGQPSCQQLPTAQSFTSVQNAKPMLHNSACAMRQPNTVHAHTASPRKQRQKTLSICQELAPHYCTCNSHVAHMRTATNQPVTVLCAGQTCWYETSPVRTTVLNSNTCCIITHSTHQGPPLAISSVYSCSFTILASFKAAPCLCRKDTTCPAGAAGPQ